MKKTQLKSLSLHKKTISNLKDSEKIKGGAVLSIWNCKLNNKIVSVVICEKEDIGKSVSNIICW